MVLHPRKCIRMVHPSTWTCMDMKFCIIYDEILRRDHHKKILVHRTSGGYWKEKAVGDNFFEILSII